MDRGGQAHATHNHELRQCAPQLAQSDVHTALRRRMPLPCMGVGPPCIRLSQYAASRAASTSLLPADSGPCFCISSRPGPLQTPAVTSGVWGVVRRPDPHRCELVQPLPLLLLWVDQLSTPHSKPCRMLQVASRPVGSGDVEHTEFILHMW